MTPATVRQHAAALIRELENDGRAVCRIMHIHLWLMLTSPQPDDGALYEDVLAVDEYLGKGRGNRA